MTIPDIGTIIIATLAVLGLLTGVAAWLYKRGGQEQAFTDALDRNTKANIEVATKLDEFKTTVLNMFHDLDKRVSRVEDRLGG